MSGFAAVVVFITTYALVLPAITLEKTAACGIEEHQHNEGCYESRLICGQEESEGHHHDDSCYTVTKESVCELEEHQHSGENGCYDGKGNLTCEIPEHSHGNSCYKDVETLTCGREESEGHHHTDACYEQVLVCGREAHVHSTECYKKDSSAVAATDGAAGAASTVTSGESDSPDYNAMPGESAEDGTSGMTDTLEGQVLSDPYVPQLDPVDMDAVMIKDTGFYYFHAEEGEDIPADSAGITDWQKVKKDTKLKSTDLVKAYFAYKIPAGSLNGSNPVARYRLPGNLHLTDEQIKAINLTENGIYASMDQEAEARKYLGVEAVEGDRKPGEKLVDGVQEYISAVVRAENIFNEEGRYLGQDLIFTFVPYTIEKNQNTYDADGSQLTAGGKITGWFACDFNMNQIDWVEEETDLDSSTVEKSAEVFFVKEDRETGRKEISTVLSLVETDSADNNDNTDGTGENPEDESDKNTTDKNTADKNTADKKAAGDNAAEAASEKEAADASSAGETDSEAEEARAAEYKSGTLTADGDGYRITLDYTEEAKIPENAELSVREITPETDQEAYEACLEQAEKQVTGDDRSALDQTASRFFDIEILVRSAGDDEGESIRKIEPAAPVSVNIQIIDTSGNAEPASGSGKTEQNDPTVLHFGEEGVEQIDSTVRESREQENGEGQSTEVQFEAESFSIYGVVYTVDFHWEVNGKTYDFSLPGGGFVSFRDLVEELGIAVNDTDTEKDEIRELVDGIENIEFSDPELVSVSKVEEDTTVGAIKESLGLECACSAELTEQEIGEIDAQEVRGGDWALISLQPFTSEETLTVAMKNGESFTIRVTDEQAASLENIDEDKSYVIYTESNGQIYVLKTDGTTVTARRSDLDGMDNNYKWKFDFVYTDLNTGISYYVIRPCDDNTKYLYLSQNTTFYWDDPNNNPLVQQGSGNVMVIPDGNGTFRFEGYNNTKLVLEDGWFAGRTGDSYNNIVIYEQDEIPQYKYNVSTNDYAMGKVCGWNDQNQYKEDAEFDAVTNNQKTNQRAITAQPQTTRYIFDYWDLNGTPLDYGATIPANSLTIPYQGSKLTAHFKKDPNYVAPDNEKVGRVIDKESFRKWLQELRDRNIPLNQDGCTKTAELYDYENRIYRVDLTAKSNLSMFDGDIDLGFIIDVSGSMQFPSKLIPVSGKESVDVLHLNDNWYTQHQLETSKEYYIIVDRTNTANVLRLKWCDGSNPAYPNHTGWPTGNPNSSSTRWYTGWGISGLGYEKDALDGATRYLSRTENELFINSLFNGDNGPFQIYEAGDSGKQRKEYLESSIAGTISELNSILGDLAYAQNAGEAADVKVAYNTFADEVDYDHTNHNFVSVTSGLSIGYDYKGGTDTEEALIDADAFFWNDSATKVAVLITDGAPQQAGVDGPTLDARVKAAADTLKNQGIKLVTVGLSMGDVKRGSRLLYDIATKDSDGDPYFYKADSGDELQYALYEVIQQVMADAIVVGTVTDTVNEAFYPVDKDTGLPLIAGNVIDLKGIKIANSVSGLTDEQKAAGYGVIGTDDNGNYTVTWSGQNFTWDGWHGFFYEKAKEDFFGGNAVRTNDPENPARIVSEGYKIHPEDPTIAFKPAITEQGTKSLETPRVNVNELDLTDNNTEWTVYLGTNVDPKSQLEAIYDNILVKEAVTAATDTDGDGFPDRMTGTSLYYPLLESISDGRESTGTGEQVTFKMKDLLKKLNNGNDISIDDLIAAGEEGITLPYDLYGQDCPGTIKITLKKTGQTADYDPHAATVTGDAVEKYDLLVDFAPDYTHLPEGQGGDGSLPYHTGEYRLVYPGHAAGEDYSTNKHVINVYEVKPDVLKTDESDRALSGAVFKLYKAGGSGTVSGLGGSYTEVASGTSGTDGVAHLTFAEGMETGLVPGTTYFLVEDQPPENYTKVNTVWTVQVQTEIGKFTKQDGQVIYAPDYPTLSQSMYPFNWDQGARIVVDGQPVKAVVKGETAGSTADITNGSYISHKDAVSFLHTVKNVRSDLEIKVNKIWQDENNPNRPSSVSVKLYRVSEKGHQWGDGRIAPCTCTTDGVKEYTCSVCHATDTHAISASGHKQGTAHRENYQAPTCTETGGYDTVVRCTICNAIISSEHTGLPFSGHTWENQEVPASDPDRYCYDTVDVCSVCGAVNEETRVHHNHDWSAWETITHAAINRAGWERRVCGHDQSHTETNEIPPLPATVNIYFRCTGNGNGGQSFTPTYITERHKDGVGDMTIQWDWNSTTGNVQSIAVEGLSGGASYNTYTTPDGVEYNVQNGVERGKRQTLTISNITTNQTIYITIRNWNYAGTNDGLIYQPTFAGNYTTPALSMSSPASSRGLNGKSLLKAGSAPNRSGGEKSAPEIPAVLSGISGLKSKGEASCGDRYWEEVSGTYTITAAENWILPVPDLDRFNEDGKEYQYYVEEISPPYGYKVTYTGQGAQQDDTVTVTNELSQGSLLITKTVQYNGRTAVTDEEKALLNGSYVFTVKKDGVEITGSPFTINVTNGVSNSVLIPDLEAGDYTIEETDSGNLTFASAAGGKSVSGDIVTAAVTVGKMTEAELLDTAKAEFTNNYIAYEVIIVKVDTGDTTSKLSGAVFDLYSEEAVENGEIKAGASPLISGLISSSDEQDKGKVSLGPLTPDTYYLFETEAPAGYIAMDMPVKIIVSENRVSLMQGSRNETGTISQERTELMVMNSSGATLPNTGGPGNKLIYLLGVMLTGIAGATLMMRRSREKAA